MIKRIRILSIYGSIHKKTPKKELFKLSYLNAVIIETLFF